MKARQLLMSIAALAVIGAFGSASAQETQAQSIVKNAAHPDTASTGGTFPEPGASPDSSSSRASTYHRRDRRERGGSDKPMTDDQRMRQGKGLDGTGETGAYERSGAGVTGSSQGPAAEGASGGLKSPR